MPQIDPLIWGIASMLTWGTADMLARYASLRVGGPAVAMITLGLGVIPPLVLGVSRYPSFASLTGGECILLVLASGLLFSFGYAIYYRGLERGLVFIVSPLTSSWMVVTTILVAIFFDERIGWTQGVLIFVILLGIALTSTSGRDGRSIAGFWYGIMGMVAFGVAFTLWKPLVSDVGPFIAVSAVRLLSALLLAIYLRVRDSIRLSFEGSTVVLLIGAALLDSLGFVTFNLGIEENPVSLIVPIAAAYPAVTLALAWVLLKERVALMQMSGIAAILGAVIAYSAVG
jgi:drug/metabolite transporter (DMT)-like permease